MGVKISRQSCLDKALAGQVPYLVSSDKDVYADATLVEALAQRGVQVVSSGQLIARLKE
jgi:hypothetical protein